MGQGVTESGSHRVGGTRSPRESVSPRESGDRESQSQWDKESQRVSGTRSHRVRESRSRRDKESQRVSEPQRVRGQGVPESQ